MKNNLWFIISIAILFVSCKKENSIATKDIISIDYNVTSDLEISEFVSNIDIIYLETSDRSLIGEISKVKLYDNRVYILDNRSNAIFLYNTSGKFINVLRTVGQGPGEYLQLNDLDVNETGVYALDMSGHKILHYNFDLSYISKINFQSIATNFIVINDGFWLYNEPSLQNNDYRLVKIDKKGEVVAKHFPRNLLPNHSYYSASTNVFQQNNNNLYFASRYSNIIYEEVHNKWIENTQLSFKDKTFNSNEDISDEDINSGLFLFRNNFYISDAFIIVDYFINHLRHFSFYNKQTQQVRSGKIKNDLIPDYDRFFPRWLDKNTLIESVDAEYILDEFQGLMKLDKSLQNLHPDDNPVLVLYQLKTISGNVGTVPT